MLDEYSDILSPNDIMKILNLSNTTVYSMLREGVIPCYRVGKGKIWRINKKDLIDYLSIMN